jgi:hypothetical protein
MEKSNDKGSSLVEVFPEAELAMQTSSNALYLKEKLHIQAVISQVDSKPLVIIQLSDSFQLKLEPSAPGYGGLQMWFGQSDQTITLTGNVRHSTQLHVNVTLLKNDPAGEVQIISFSQHVSNVERLITSSLAITYRFCSLRLVPLPIVTVENETPLTNQPNHAAKTIGDDSY